jgi:carboxymethylenebutenolidase
MKDELLHIKTSDGECEAYLFTPAKTEQPKLPILMFMDAFGVRPTLKEMCQEFARRGHTVLLPNLFYRDSALPVIPQLSDPVTPEDMKRGVGIFKEFMGHLTPDLLLRDSSFYLDTLLSHSQGDSASCGIVGFCMGGAHALRVASKFPQKVSALASFHGGKLNEAIGGLSQVEARMYFAHADKDSSMPADKISEFEAALDASGVRYESETYEGAPHGFTMRDLPMFQQAAYEKYLKATQEIFKWN